MKNQAPLNQHLGRLFRVGQEPVIVVPYEETMVAQRIAEKMKHISDLPVVVIHDETVKLKGHQAEELLLPRKGPKIIKKWGLT